MAQQVPQANDRKRVKVYELRENDWYDRGTGFCTGQVINDEPKILVESEDQPERMLLETRIVKDDSYQKQQDTLIVWTEPNGTDMALSFQEADGCAAIWDFLRQVQQHLVAMSGPDDYPSDDAMDFAHAIGLPSPDLGSLPDIEQVMRAASTNPAGRDHLAKFIVREEYIKKLIPLVEMAEDLESLTDLHRLCNIMKSLILLNDNAIIEQVVSDDIILGVVGALEYDPDFPTHKANHRAYLSDPNRYREVVPIKDPVVRQKIRNTWRLQYLKDVVLARILDDPTFSVLNSLIFFHQVDIVTHVQGNQALLKELFSLFDVKSTDNKRKEDAVQFLHQCAAIAKNLQAPARAQLFVNFINHGLFLVIAFAIKHPNPSLRTTGIDILVSLLDHDPGVMRGYMLRAVRDKRTPLTDTLIDLLHAETDLGVKNQLADAIKILLDPQAPVGEFNRSSSDGFLSKLNRPAADATQQANEQFAQDHFDRSCKKLFAPMKALEGRSSMTNLTYQDVSLYSHLLEILTYFVRQHSLRSRHFVSQDNLAPRAAQLLLVPQKPLKLTALKFFRTCISLQDQFYATQMTLNNTFELILDIVMETMPRDNLLNSACLEMFEYIKRENIKPVIIHIVEQYREKLDGITYVDTFQNLVRRYEQMHASYTAEADANLFTQEEGTPPRSNVNGQRWPGLKEMDADQEEYFNTSDDEDEGRPSDLLDFNASRTVEGELFEKQATINGETSPLVRPLVDYPDDDEEEATEIRAAPPAEIVEPPVSEQKSPAAGDSPSPSKGANPPERLSEKRRREEEEDEDELGKLSTGIKRRSSNASTSSASSLRRRKGVLGMGKKENQSLAPEDTGKKKISVHLQTNVGKDVGDEGQPEDSKPDT